MVSQTLKMVSRHFCSTLWTFWTKIRTFENFEQIVTLKMVSLTLKMVSRHFCSTLWTFWPKIRTFENFKILKNFDPQNGLPDPQNGLPTLLFNFVDVLAKDKNI